MREQRGYPLDYIVSVPPSVMYKFMGKTNLATIARVTKKKNAVMRRVVEIRQMKAKPKLNQLLAELKDPRLKDRAIPEAEKEAIRKENRKRLRKKIMELYDDSGEQLSDADMIKKSVDFVKMKCSA
jgi:hypothetical protein